VRSKSKIQRGSPNGTLILKHRCLASIVHSKLDYCNSLYYNLPKSQIFAYKVLSPTSLNTLSNPHKVFSLHVESARLLIHRYFCWTFCIFIITIFRCVSPYTCEISSLLRSYKLIMFILPLVYLILHALTICLSLGLLLQVFQSQPCRR